MRKEIVALLLIAGLSVGFLLGIGIGVKIGAKAILKGVVEVGKNFINEESFDEDLIHQAITQYKGRIGVCYNASVFDNSWNKTVE